MRHHTAAPLTDGSGWHYASVHRSRGGYPLGYCADHGPHPTADEARRCYRQWQRDHVGLDGKCSWTSCDVKGCEKPANSYARIDGDGYAMATLCEDHLTIRHALTALGLDGDLAGDAWQS